jgi:RNA polymerase sigma factor (sigma-70 family)
MSLGSSSCAPRLFPNTRWSVVLAVQQQSSADAGEAMENLCRAYWQPLYLYVRRCGHSSHDAQDLTQEFFRRLIEKRWLDAVDRERGRLRTFLVVALKRFLHNERRRAFAQRRGGGEAPQPFDTAMAERRLAAGPDAGGPEEMFDRQWALTLIELTLERLSGEFAAAGKQSGFETLRECLVAERGRIDYAGLAKQLQASEGAVRVAVHRLRKRFRELYREEILRTLSADDDLEEEMRHLVRVLNRG